MTSRQAASLFQENPLRFPCFAPSDLPSSSLTLTEPGNSLHFSRHTLTPRAIARIERPATFHQTNGEILLWQGKIRLGLVGLAVAIIAALRLVQVREYPLGSLLVLVALYAVAVGAVITVVRQAGGARDWVIAAMLSADVLFLYGATFLAVPSHHYERTLILSFIILHLTEFYFGRALAVAALVMMIVAHVGMVWYAIAQGAQIGWLHEMWSLAIFGIVAASFVMQYGHFKRRLARLAKLFENVEEGDFSGTYDIEADARPDSITFLGRAYNRVRTQLHTLVLTDPLSGCLNRRGFEQQFQREIARAARGGTTVALIALDVDFFKEINDNFGHLAGDGVVRELGGLLREIARTGDLVARLGGDEFAVLLPDTDADGAFAVAGRIRQGVAAHRFRIAKDSRPMSVSLGVVADRATDENVTHDLQSRADEALYAAKEAGRDRVCLWTPDLRAIAVTAAHHRVTKPLREQAVGSGQ